MMYRYWRVTSVSLRLLDIYTHGGVPFSSVASFLRLMWQALHLVVRNERSIILSSWWMNFLAASIGFYSTINRTKLELLLQVRYNVVREMVLCMASKTCLRIVIDSAPWYICPTKICCIQIEGHICFPNYAYTASIYTSLIYLSSTFSYKNIWAIYQIKSKYLSSSIHRVMLINIDFPRRSRKSISNFIYEMYPKWFNSLITII